MYIKLFPKIIWKWLRYTGTYHSIYLLNIPLGNFLYLDHESAPNNNAPPNYFPDLSLLLPFDEVPSTYIYNGYIIIG